MCTKISNSDNSFEVAIPGDYLHRANFSQNYKYRITVFYDREGRITDTQADWDAVRAIDWNFPSLHRYLQAAVRSAQGKDAPGETE